MGATNEPSPGVIEKAAEFMAVCYLRRRGIKVSSGTLGLRTPEEIARGERSVLLCPVSLEGGETA